VKIGQPTLDQLRLFLAVVDEGSFNRAARKLGRALSVVSYGIATLEAQLGVSLFDREGSRRPELTEAGRALLADARAVADEVDSLMARARGIRQGLETELALAVDVMFPSAVVATVLHDFQAVFPTVDLRLNVEALGASPRWCSRDARISRSAARSSSTTRARADRDRPCRAGPGRRAGPSARAARRDRARAKPAITCSSS
jgi:DNA-binding transcriptional LysR family regulator